MHAGFFLDLLFLPCVAARNGSLRGALCSMQLPQIARRADACSVRTKLLRTGKRSFLRNLIGMSIFRLLDLTVTPNLRSHCASPPS